MPTFSLLQGLSKHIFVGLAAAGLGRKGVPTGVEPAFYLHRRAPGETKYCQQQGA